MGRCYELKEKLSNIPAKFVVWARRRGALPYLTGMEVYGNDMRPVFRVSIKEDRKDKSLSGKAQTVVLRFDCSEGRIRPECQIGGNRTITVESIKEERDYSWIKRLYK